MFALHGMPLTPEPGERFGSKEGARDSVTRQELKALFQVTGAWFMVRRPAVSRPMRRQVGAAGGGRERRLGGGGALQRPPFA